MHLDPGEVLATNDPGDEVARRFRYQWTWTAIACCMLFDEYEHCVEVMCEQHEDILVKLESNFFHGLQIKSRDESLEPWKTSDEAVKSSFVRFCQLEQRFPGRFQSFKFLTNHRLHSAGNGKDIRYVLDQVRTAATIEALPLVVRRYVTSIASECSCDDETVCRTLRKTEADDSLPKLADMEVRLIKTLTENWERAQDIAYPAIERAARRLVAECARAASLAHTDVLPAYLPATATPVETELAARIAGKRIDLARLVSVLEDGLNATSSLQADPAALIAPGTGNRSLLQKKLDAGGFSVVSQNSAEDLHNKADYLGLVWVQKYGREEGLQRYSHIRSVALQDAASAFEAAKSLPAPFGIPMLNNFRNRIQSRRAGGTELYGCSNEHLEGVAFTLTSECTVQWSLDRPWEVE